MSNGYLPRKKSVSLVQLFKTIWEKQYWFASNDKVHAFVGPNIKVTRRNHNLFCTTWFARCQMRITGD